MPNVDKPDENADNTDNLCEGVPKVVQLPLEWGLFGHSGGNGFMNLTDGRMWPREHNQCLSCSVDNSSSL